MPHSTHSDEAINSHMKKYHVTGQSKNTGTKEHPSFGPSGVRNKTGEKVYTKRDVTQYEKATNAGGK